MFARMNQEDMTARAREYIQTFDWCPPITRQLPRFEAEGVLALVHFVFAQAIEDTDRALWVVVGDLPSAYFVYEGNERVRDALEQYCGLMEDWATAARNGASVEELFPVDAEPTAENAEALQARLAFIRAEILPKVAG